MNLDASNLENMMFEFIDQIKTIMSEEMWENILLNCTKNELFVLMQLYRGSDVNMTQIADYLNVPLNTATGIVSRMEKKHMLQRVRSQSDKRVVTIVLTETGDKQINDILKMFLVYGEKVLGSLTTEELNLSFKLMDKLMNIFKEVSIEEKEEKSKIRKITIE